VDPDLHLWQSIGSTPLGVDAPTGVSIRYDADFERLDAQIRKLESVTGEQVDWTAVVSIGRGILEHKSKDLLVASYLALGLFRTDGYRGLARGLSCLERLVDAFWPVLYPEMKRLRARMNALTWLSERAGTEVARRAPGAGEAESVKVCDDVVARLAATLEGLAGTDAVGLVELRRALKERIGQLATTTAAAPQAALQSEGRPAEASPGPAAAAERVEEKPPAAPAPSPVVGSGGIETREDCQRTVREAGAALRRAAAFLRRQSPSQPSSYRLIRAITWFEVDALPPNVEGRTRIPSPSSPIRDRCLALLSRGDWADLLNQAEARFPECPFWFDLQRFCAEALAGLGPQYARALDAVRAEVAALLTRLPNLVDLQFADGVPFADEATRSWLVGSVILVPESAPLPPVVASDRTDVLDDLRVESRRLAADRQVEAALTLLQNAARRAPDERTRFLIQFELARTCLELGQTRAALASFDVLDQRMARFALDSWDPSLAAEVLQVHWRALSDAQRTTKDSDLAGRLEVVYTRLCALDMVAGLRVRQAGDARASGASRTSSPAARPGPAVAGG